ncbi:MAG: ABC transporter substrate-binding protein [Gemmatimonadales bacterium]
MKTVGYLSRGADPEWLPRLLATHGHIEGRNLRCVVRVASEDEKRLREQGQELVRLPADVLLTFGATNINLLTGLTRTIPIVCGGTADPIGIGYAKTLRRPGGNVTGLSYGVPEIAQVNVGLMRTLLPGLKRVVCVVDRSPRGREAAGWGRVLAAFDAAAGMVGARWEIVPAGTADELEDLVSGLDRRTTVAYHNTAPEVIPYATAAACSIRHRLASFSASGQFAREGALLHYSINHADAHRRIAAIVHVLLRGANPAETPFEVPDRTTCIVNRATAKAIGITLPAEVLARATEIIG